MTTDRLSQGRKAHGLPPSGEYLAEIVPGSARNQLYRNGTGVDFEIEIKEGDFAGRRLVFHFLLEARDELLFITGRNWRVLDTWSKAVGAKPAEDDPGIFRELWEASLNRRVWLKLQTDTNPRTGFSNVAIEDVRVESGEVDDASPF